MSNLIPFKPRKRRYQPTPDAEKNLILDDHFARELARWQHDDSMYGPALILLLTALGVSIPFLLARLMP